MAILGYGQIQYGIGPYGGEQSFISEFKRKAMATGTEGTILLDIELDDKHLYLSDKYITVTHEHEGVVSDWGSLDLSAGSSSIGEVSDVSITFFNKRLMYMTTDDRISDMLDNYNWEGRIATLKQYFDGLGYADCRILMSGKIANIGFNDLYFYFDIMDDRAVFNKIPVNKISKQEYPEAPAIVIGKPKPIIYGIPVTNDGLHEDKWTLWPARLVNSRTHKLLIANHKVGQNTFPDEVGTKGRIRLYMSDIKHYARLTASNAVYVNSDAGTTLELNQPIYGDFYLRPTIKGTQYTAGTTDYSSILDEDNTNFITLSAGEKFYLKFTKLPDLGKIAYGSSYLALRASFGTLTGSSPYGVFHYYNPDYDNGNTPDFSTGANINLATSYYNFGADFSKKGVRDDQDDSDDPWTWDEIAGYEWGITVNAECSIEIKALYLAASNLIIPSSATQTSSGRQVIPPTRWTGGG